tara:strand:- start:6085 stop:7347 length:1263 start_codon:yes stop_codon:yes gene_type:complete
MTDKIKVFTLSDMPFSPSGVGSQTKYICEALLDSGKFEIVSFGGAIQHQDNNPMKTEKYGDEWIVFPVNGYGSAELVRSLLRQQKPDILWFMTDPRFWGWLWEIENEIRPLMPMVYYHVWDNYPYPTYNSVFYNSNDRIATISKVTDDIVKTVAPDVTSEYVPHAVNTEIFKLLDKDEIEEFKKLSFGDFYDSDKKVFFWNNRNARRKQSGSLLFWFKELLNEVGDDKAMLVMHTEVKDPHGQDLQAIIDKLELNNGQVLFSQAKVAPEDLAKMYNAADCTINVSDAEGFGLATLESLACETPIIVNMTGGLQEQVTDGEKWFGVGIEPSSKAIIGSQEIPWIYEDRLSGDSVVAAMKKILDLSDEERAELGSLGREHVLKNYNFEDFNKKWVDFMLKVHEEEGSWDTRKPIKFWSLEEL